MIKNEDKIKSIEQFLNIVFDNYENEIDDFYEDFILRKEWKFEEDRHYWACSFESLNSCSKIEVIFNDSKGEYGGDITGFECGEYDLYDEDYSRSCIILSVWDSKIKTKKTFYKKIKDNFLRIVQMIDIAEKEDKETYDNECLERYGHTSDELTEEKIDELEGESTYDMMVKEGWIDED